MRIDRAAIETLVPHAGSMCLLDAVAEWTAGSITCTSAAPGPRHPLARAGQVPAIAAAEYAAQATAVHGALLEPGGGPRTGLLATLMDMRLTTTVIPAEGGALTVRADLLSRSPAGCLYSFEVANDATSIAAGRLLVALSAKEPA